MSDETAEPTQIFTDGACKGNPGPGGWGAILRAMKKDGEATEKEMSGSEGATTNNRMELTAAIRALQALKRPCKVALYTDSKYVIDGITKWVFGWQKKGWKTAAKKPTAKKAAVKKAATAKSATTPKAPAKQSAAQKAPAKNAAGKAAKPVAKKAAAKKSPARKATAAPATNPNRPASAQPSSTRSPGTARRATGSMDRPPAIA